MLLVGIATAEFGAVEITRESDRAAYVVSVTTIPHLAAAVLLPQWVAMLLAAAGMLVDEVRALAAGRLIPDRHCGYLGVD